MQPSRPQGVGTRTGKIFRLLPAGATGRSDPQNGSVPSFPKLFLKKGGPGRQVLERGLNPSAWKVSPSLLNSGKGSSAPTLVPKLFSHRTLSSKGPLSPRHIKRAQVGPPGGSRCRAEPPPLLAHRPPLPSAPGPGRALLPLPPPAPTLRPERASQLRAERLGGEPREGLPFRALHTHPGRASAEHLGPVWFGKHMRLLCKPPQPSSLTEPRSCSPKARKLRGVGGRCPGRSTEKD